MKEGTRNHCFVVGAFAQNKLFGLVAGREVLRWLVGRADSLASPRDREYLSPVE